MLEIGSINKLEVIKKVEFGIYLYGDEYDPEILLPRKYVPENCNLGDFIDVFVYFDSEDRIIATTKTPKAMADEFALLKVVAVTRFGAFLDWGLEKDLFVPFREQKQKMEQGKSYLVFIYVDEQTDRLVASSKLDQWLNKIPVKYEDGQEVDLLIAHQTDLGTNAIINDVHWGFIFKTDLFQNLKRGQRIKGYIKKVREDKKIDLMLQKPGYEKVDHLAKIILKELLENDGFISVTDKSSTEEISKLFGVSKKTYKKAIGALYKKKAITIESDGIKLNKNELSA